MNSIGNKFFKYFVKDFILVVKDHLCSGRRRIKMQVSTCNTFVIVTYMRKEEQNAEYFTKRDFNRSVKNGLPVSALKKSVR